MRLTASEDKKHVAVSGDGIEKEKIIFLTTARSIFFPIVYVGPPSKIPVSIFLKNHEVVGKPMERFSFLAAAGSKVPEDTLWEIKKEDALKQLENAGIAT